MDTQNKGNPAACEALTGPDTNAFPGGNDEQIITPNAPATQAETASSPAVAAALQRARARLLAIKRSSVWSLANMAGAEHDELMAAFENVDDEAILNHGALFIGDVRGFAKLLADFRDARRSGR